MHRKILIVMLPILSLIIVPLVVQAETIIECTFDKDTYQQGETGYITVTIYNDKEEKIRVTELTATINYYYTGENIYIQKFYTETTLPSEVQPGNSGTFYISFTLPSNIASGYTNVYTKAVTEKWDLEWGRWHASEHPTSQPTLHIESPYKQQSEDYQQQLEEQVATNQNTTNMMYLFGITTIVFAAVTGFLLVLYRRARLVFAQPIA